MSNLMERGKKEIPKTTDPVIEVDKRKRDIMGVFEILEDIIGRADLAEEELRKSIEFLRDFQKQKYAEILKLLQEENEEEALVLLKDSDDKAMRARLAARDIESLMDDLVKRTEALKGIIKPEKNQ
jgi:hypothetical protein